MKRMNKDPNETLDFEVDWADRLGDDTISTSAWTVAAGLTQVTATNTTTAATIWLSGGTLGTRYRVTNRVVTAGGRTLDRSFDVVIVDR